MSATTYDRFASLDPTNTPLFRMAMILQRMTAAAKLRVLVELTRLVLLGFYDDFCRFIDHVEQAENQSQGEAGFSAVSSLKLSTAEKTSKLIQRLERMKHVSYKGTNLIDYLIGDNRLEEMSLFVQMVKLEAEGEQILAKAKMGFMAAFGKHKLSKNQRTALLEKYRELLPVASATGDSAPLKLP